MLMRCLFIVILSLTFFLVHELAAKDVTIVTSGPTEPDTVYLSRNAAALQQVPLDGVCTWIATPTPVELEAGGTDICRVPSGRLKRHVTGEDGFDVGQSVVFRRRIPEANITPAIADLQSAEFDRFHSNFISAITGNARGPIDWYDDEWWATICHNIGMIAKAAKQGGCKGILIDPEVYSYSWWNYQLLTETQPSKLSYRRGNKEMYKGKTIADVTTKVRQRGREFAIAINAEFADPVLMFFHAVSYAAWQTEDPRWDTYAEAPFGLIAAFIDGILEASTDETTIVDCASQVKWWSTRAQFERARRLTKDVGATMSKVPEQYRKKVQMGFTLRLGVHPNEEQIGEQRNAPLPWESWMYDPDSPESNYFSPEKLEKTLKLALEVGDGYILFWNYRATWWLDSADARPAGDALMSDRNRYVPRVYWQALENARASVQ